MKIHLPNSSKPEFQGIIEIRPWPNFGSLPSQNADKYPKIDNSVYIFSYFLALNLCILDIKTTIGSVADFDEVMVPRNGTMLEYASKEMTGTNVGALLFKNSYVSLEPSIYDNEFTGVSKPVFLDGTAAPKVKVFRLYMSYQIRYFSTFSMQL